MLTPGTTKPNILELPADVHSRLLYFKGCLGFGDNFYQRPVIRYLVSRFRAVYLETAFPEAYWDIPDIHFVAPPSDLPLRTQRRHVATRPVGTFVIPPSEPEGPRWSRLDWSFFPPGYFRRPDGAMTQLGFEHEHSNAKFIRRKAGMDTYEFFFPIKEQWIADARQVIEPFKIGKRKLCLFRPATVRREWAAPSRNPKPSYLQLLIDEFRDRFYFFSVADMEDGEEWFDGEAPRNLDAWYHHGEVSLTTLLGLIKIADMVVCPPGLMLPAAVATRTKCFCVFGGMQKPETLIDPSMGLENFDYIAPEPFCNCYDMKHACFKGITRERLLLRFGVFAERIRQPHDVSIGVPPGVGDIHWIMTKMESFKRRAGVDRLTLAVHEDIGHRYSGQYLDLLPFVDHVIRFPVALTYDFGIRGGHGRPVYRGEQGLTYKMEFNSALERGQAIEDILPEFETHWDYEIAYPPASRDYALSMKERAGGRLILFYASSEGANAKWAREDWTTGDWMELLLLIRSRTNKERQKIVLLGAPWDRAFANRLLKLDEMESFIDLVGSTDLPQVLALIREASVLIGYPSGLSVMAAQFQTPCVMFWPINKISKGGEFEAPFIRSWLPPWARTNGRYLPVVYGSAEARPRAICNSIKEFIS